MLMFFTIVGPSLATAGLSCREILEPERSSRALGVFNREGEFGRQFIKTDRKDDPEETRFKMKYLSQYFFHRDLLFKQQLFEPEKIFPQTYKVRGENPFLGYLVAREKIFAKNLDEVLTLQGLAEIHRDLLQAYPEGRSEFLGERSTRNSEGTPDSELGRIRDSYIGFRFSESELMKGQLIILNSHHFLRDEASPKSLNDLLAKNPYLTYEEGYVEFGDIRNWRRFPMELASGQQRLLKALERGKLSEAQVKALRGQVLQDLTQKCLDQLIVDLRAHQDSRSRAIKGQTLFFNLAQFMQTFVSLHPFANGNGRLVRLVVERVLSYFDELPPIWTYPDRDVTLSVSQLAIMLEDSVAESASLWRAYRRNPSQFVEKFDQGVSKAVLPLKVLYDRDRSEFDPVPMSRSDFENFRSSCSECRTDSQALNAYSRWKTVEAPEHERPGTLQIIPRDFMEGFAQPVRSEVERQERLDQFYRPTLMYRGVVTEEKINLDMIIRHFTHVVDSTAGMGVRATPASMKKAMRDFNQDLSKIGAFKKKYLDHLLAEGRYWSSKMSSWSLEYDVGREFQVAWGNLDKDSGYGILMIAKVPIYGAVESDKASSQMKLDNPYSTEKEVSVVGGLEPLALERVSVEQPLTDESGASLEGPQKIDVQRLDFNTLKVMIYRTDVGPNRPAAWRLEDSFRVRLNPDGSYKRLR